VERDPLNRAVVAMRFAGGSSDKEIRASRGSGIASPGLRFLELSTLQRFVEVYSQQ
jgi:hypothetical protein